MIGRCQFLGCRSDLGTEHRVRNRSALVLLCSEHETLVDEAEAKGVQVEVTPKSTTPAGGTSGGTVWLDTVTKIFGERAT